METLSFDWLGFVLLVGLQGCSGYLSLGSGAGVVIVRTGSVGGIPPQQALLHQLNPSWPAGSKDAAVVAAAAVAVEGLAAAPSWCGWYEKGQTAACEFAAEGLEMNPSERGGPGLVEPAAHLVCYTSRHCHLHLKVSSAPCENGCVSGNWDGYAENVGSAGSAGRFGSAECVAESVRAHMRCDGDVAGAVCRGPHFHNGPRSPGTHAVADVNVWYGSGKENQ